MKFLVLALCVCAASAASFGYKPYQPKQFQGFQPALAPAVAAKTTYNTAQLAIAPVDAAKATYNAVNDSPVVGAKSVYKVPQAVEIVAEPVYEAAKFVAAVPVVAAKAAYDTARVAPKAVYNTGKEAEASIVRSDSDVTAEGYAYAYETDNGISAQSSGALKNVDGVNALVSTGSFAYPSPDGSSVTLEYVADENGYQPRSDILPVGPAVPEHIIRALEYIRTHAPVSANN